MNKEGYIWAVESLGDDTPTMLSLHDTQEKALAARDAYIKHYQHGGSADDYWVHAIRINQTGLEED